jgi:succinyl-diaminopimelate desuccinylase
MDVDVGSPVAELTRALVDVGSASGDEAVLADAVEAALSGLGRLRVDRDGDAVVARTALRRPRRVLLAGHLDTVPAAGNLPARLDGGRLYGCGASDMKAGLAVMLRLAAALDAPRHDVTWVFYDHEEVAYALSGLGRLMDDHPDWLAADAALVLEPTSGQIEAGCQGTLRVEANATGARAHAARSWLGDNAIHRLAPLLERLAGYRPRTVTLEGCTYREGLNAVRIAGGVAGNVVPDECTVMVNYRFAPDRDEKQALDHVAEVLAGLPFTVVDSAPAAPPSLRTPAIADFVAATGRVPVAKYGWTDVARFAAFGVPAVNYGPGDPDLAHTRDEYVLLDRIVEAEQVLRAYLG